MRNIVLLSVLMLGLVSSLSAQKSWTTGTLNGVNYFMTGKVSILAADSLSTDTTNGTSTIYSAVMSNSTYRVMGGKVLAGYVVLDTANGQNRSPYTEKVSVHVQGSLDGTTFVNIVDSVVSYKPFAQSGATAKPPVILATIGWFNLGVADLTNYSFPYVRLVMTLTGTPGSGTYPGVGYGAPRIRWVLKSLTK